MQMAFILFLFWQPTYAIISGRSLSIYKQLEVVHNASFPSQHWLYLCFLYFSLIQSNLRSSLINVALKQWIYGLEMIFCHAKCIMCINTSVQQKAAARAQIQTKLLKTKRLLVLLISLAALQVNCHYLWIIKNSFYYII